MAQQPSFSFSANLKFNGGRFPFTRLLALFVAVYLILHGFDPSPLVELIR
jgi:hypothetical protein